MCVEQNVWWYVCTEGVVCFLHPMVEQWIPQWSGVPEKTTGDKGA